VRSQERRPASREPFSFDDAGSTEEWRLPDGGRVRARKVSNGAGFSSDLVNMERPAPFRIYVDHPPR
jgi:hypothetical protein